MRLKTGARWATIKTVRRNVGVDGAYRWEYGPAVKGAYRMRAQYVAPGAYWGSSTKWLTFAVR